MNYRDTVEYLYRSTPVFEHVGASAYKEGLDTTLALDERLGHPHRRYETIHIAGTNGKGSCSHTLAAILQAAGRRVGLYTSPHLVDFRERIRVDGEMISQQEVVDFVERHRAFFEPLHPSFFELTTAMALDHFARHQVDVAVVEVGLGGRLDCTNIIRPRLSVITNISMDHTQFLGDTLAKIAGEKAGIIKAHTPVVIGEATDETRPVFERRARETGAPIHFAEDTPEVTGATPRDGGISYQTRHYGTLWGELAGDYQPRNTNTLLTALHTLGFADTEAIGTGLAHVTRMTGLMGRWQTLAGRPLTVCDTGHNAGGWQYLTRQISRVACRERHIVFGMVDDKDIDSVMAMLPADAHYYWTQATTHRAIPGEEVRRRGQAHGLRGTAYPTVDAALRAAQSAASDDDFIFVGGSSYVVADLLAGREK